MPRSAIFVLLLCASAAAPVGGPARQDPIARLSFMAGCWELRRGERVSEEQWMRPRGGLMLGSGRTVDGGRVRSFEQLRIREEDGVLVYHSEPSGQPPADFRAVEVTDSSVVFANPRHDYPQRILYRRAARGDSLLARIEGTMDGRQRAFDFPFARARCNPAD